MSVLHCRNRILLGSVFKLSKGARDTRHYAKECAIHPLLSVQSDTEEQHQLTGDMAKGGIPLTTRATTLQCLRHTISTALGQAPVVGEDNNTETREGRSTILYNSFTLFLQNLYDLPRPAPYTLQRFSRQGRHKGRADDRASEGHHRQPQHHEARSS